MIIIFNTNYKNNNIIIDTNDNIDNINNNYINK